MVAAVYNRIARLTNRIKEESGATKRRALCNELRELLGVQSNREMLLQEGHGAKKALSAVWTMIIKAALFSAAKASKKSNKYVKEDVLFPYYMLVRLDEFAKFANTDSLLATKEVKELLTYCLNLLAIEGALNVAEADLMNMLEHMCSRPDYVAHFRSDREIQNILSELEVRLAMISKPKKGQQREHQFFEKAAKALATLLNTVKSLGTGMQMLIPSVLTVIDTWCRDYLHRIRFENLRTSEILGVEHMFGAAAAILSSHPEHAIFELSVRGRGTFKLAKKCYLNEASKKNKEALIEYFLAHL